MQSLFCEIYNLQIFLQNLQNIDRQIRYYGRAFDHYDSL